MRAGDRCGLYRHDSEPAPGSASNFATRSVLRELCKVATDAGVAQIGHDRMAERLGIGKRTMVYALQRLMADGWVTRAVRGTGNKHGVKNRENVYVIAFLPDLDGNLGPDHGWVWEAWSGYTETSRYLRLTPQNRQAVRDARWPLLSANQPPTKCTPLQPNNNYRELETVPGPRAQQRHPRAADRARQRFEVIK